MVNPTLMVAGGIAAVVIIGIIFFAIAYRKKALVFEAKETTEGYQLFFLGNKSYRKFNKDGKDHIRIPGEKEGIPIESRYEIPSKINNQGLVLIKHNDSYAQAAPSLMNVEVKDGQFVKADLDFLVVPYDYKAQFVETVMSINKQFSNNKTILIAGGILAITAIAMFLMFYYSSQNFAEYVGNIPTLAQQCQEIFSSVGGNIPT